MIRQMPRTSRHIWDSLNEWSLAPQTRHLKIIITSWSPSKPLSGIHLSLYLSSLSVAVKCNNSQGRIEREKLDLPMLTERDVR